MDKSKPKVFSFSKHIFSYVLFPLIIIIGFISYYRFFVKHDYIMIYESECDPYLESCFIGCEDETCTKEYYFFKMQKYAADLYKECGKDIIGCEASRRCLPEDRECSVEYCDISDIDDICDALTKDQKDENIGDDFLKDYENKKDI